MSKLGLILFVLWCAVTVLWAWRPLDEQYLTITMLNIGQGDSVYIQTPLGQDILVDGGRDRSVLYELGSVMPARDHVIEWVVATHPDADHIAGLSEIMDVYRVEHLFWNGREKETASSDALLKKARDSNVQLLQPQRGDRIELEPHLTLEFFHPASELVHEDTNDDSIIFLLRYKEATSLFTGDASQNIEEELVRAYGERLNAKVLKVSHHGSRTGTSEAFVSAVHPRTALISAGVDNEYGHPHAAPLYRLQQAGAEIFRTDRHGRVRCTTNGDDFLCTPLCTQPWSEQPSRATIAAKNKEQNICIDY